MVCISLLVCGCETSTNSYGVINDPEARVPARNEGAQAASSVPSGLLSVDAIATPAPVPSTSSSGNTPMYQAQSRPIDREIPAAGVASSTIAAIPNRRSSCTRPELTVTAPGPPVSLGSPPVQLSFAAPQFSGRDAVNLEQRLDTLAQEILANRRKEWKECPTASPLQLECFQWKIGTTCDVVELGSVLSVVCTNRLSDEYPARPVVDYSAVHATRCDGSLIFPSFEKELCPAWSCLDRLHETFLRNGLEDSPVLNESSRATFKSMIQQFYFTKTHVVFLLGEHASVRLRYDERFEYGYNVLAVTYADMLHASPKAFEFLQSVGLVAH